MCWHHQKLLCEPTDALRASTITAWQEQYTGSRGWLRSRRGFIRWSNDWKCKLVSAQKTTSCCCSYMAVSWNRLHHRTNKNFKKIVNNNNNFFILRNYSSASQGIIGACITPPLPTVISCGCSSERGHQRVPPSAFSLIRVERLMPFFLCHKPLSKRGCLKHWSEIVHLMWSVKAFLDNELSNNFLR